MKTSTVTGNTTFGFSFQSSGIAILILYQNPLKYAPQKDFSSNVAVICLYKQMRSLLDMKTLINMLISFLYQTIF